MSDTRQSRRPTIAQNKEERRLIKVAARRATPLGRQDVKLHVPVGAESLTGAIGPELCHLSKRRLLLTKMQMYRFDGTHK
jgi:hypothetical protein